MTPAERSHHSCVDRWIARMAPETAEDWRQLLQLGVNAIWRRAAPALGPVTLGAVLNRVLHSAGDGASLGVHAHVGEDGLSLGDSAWTGTWPDDAGAAAGAVRAVLAAFLTVLGRVTADVLVEPLHAELEQMHAGELRANLEAPRQDREA